MVEDSMYLDVRQFADRSGLPFKAIERMIEDKRLPHVIIGRRRMIQKGELDRLPDILNGVQSVIAKGTKDGRLD